METKINIAAILKDKPQGTKLYDWLYNIDVELDTISTTDTETVVWCTNETDNNTTCHRGYSEFGTVRGCTDGLQILLPSKEMRDWGQFAWKKGDVLMAGVDNICIFNKWNNDEYTEFDAAFVTPDYRSDVLKTKYWHNVINENVIKRYISKIEKNKGGKLNLTTLEIEKIQPEFKDGDMISLELRYIDSEDVTVETYIVHDDYNYGEELNFYAGCNNLCMIKHNSCVKPTNTSVRKVFIRYATDSEKKQLFDTLAKEGKAWDAKKKMIVDLKPKYEFKPMDLCLMKYIGQYNNRGWELCQYAYTEHRVSSIGEQRDFYHAVGGEIYAECIPYKGNEHLLGTTKDVKG